MHRAPSNNLQISYEWEFDSGIKWKGDVKKILGYTQEDLSAHWFEIIHREDFPKFEKKLKKSIEEKKSFIHEYRMRKKGGSYITVKEVGKISLNDSGEAVRMTGTIVTVA